MPENRPQDQGSIPERTSPPLLEGDGIAAPGRYDQGRESRGAGHADEPRLFPGQADPDDRIAQGNADHVHPRNGPLRPGFPQPSPGGGGGSHRVRPRLALRTGGANGRVEWYDLDLPEVIELRRKFIGDEGERYHLLGCSVLEDAWLEAVKVQCILSAPSCFWPKQFSSTSQKRRSSRWCSRCATISQAQSWSSTAGGHSKSGWVTAISPTRSLRV